MVEPVHVLPSNASVCFEAVRGFAGLVRVRGGTLDDASWLRPTRHIWTRRKQPWITLPEGDQVFEGLEVIRCRRQRQIGARGHRPVPHSVESTFEQQLGRSRDQCLATPFTFRGRRGDHRAIVPVIIGSSVPNRCDL